MTSITRRSFLEMAVALGATAVWGQRTPAPSSVAWRERRDIYPEGVASGDPESDSVLLWTRRPPFEGRAAERLTVEVAQDELFHHTVAKAEAPITEVSDWTWRVCAAVGLIVNTFIERPRDAFVGIGLVAIEFRFTSS